MSYADFFVCYNFWRWRFAVFHLAFLRSMRDKQPTECNRLNVQMLVKLHLLSQSIWETE